MPPRVSVILPTYREAENLPHLLPRISESLRAAGYAHEIIIVDDDSADSTRAVCERLAADLPVRLVVREGERGLATAVVRGMQEAEGDVLVVMDADGSHPPTALPELVAAVADGAHDLAIGSRYVPGGSTDEGHGVLHRLNSHAATLLARPLTRAHDPMSGFLALRKETVEQGDALTPVGYKIGLELIVKCHLEGAGPGGGRRIIEIPIDFGVRVHGASKLGVRAQIDYLRHLGRLFAYRILGRSRLAARPRIRPKGPDSGPT